MRRIIVLLLIFLSVTGLISCRKTSTRNSEPQYATVTVTSSPFLNPTAVSPTPSPTPTFEPLPETANHITWVTFGLYPISARNAYEINKLLYEKGYDCSIVFVSDGFADDISVWLRDYIAENGQVDIIHSGIWYDFDDGAFFMRDNFVPLTAYLKSSEGRALYDAFPVIDWEREIIDGEIYGVPFVDGNDKLFNRAVYVSVRDDFSEAFENNNYSFSFLREVQKNAGKDPISLSDVNTLMLNALIGYETWFEYFPYDKESQSFVDITVSEEAKSTLDELYSGLKDGTIVNLSNGSFSSNDKSFIAEYYIGLRTPKPGYTDYLIAGDSYWTKQSLNTGVSKNCTQKELALKILTACYSDPELISLLHPMEGYGEWFSVRKTFLANEETNVLTGFLPDLLPGQTSMLTQYEDSWANMFSLLYPIYDSSTGTYNLAKDFYASTALKTIQRSQSVCEILTEEWRKHRNSQK